ncbi:MAG: hypothetical protein AAF456_09510 [Planctomycetota bacterium]
MSNKKAASGFSSGHGWFCIGGLMPHQESSIVRLAATVDTAISTNA